MMTSYSHIMFRQNDYTKSIGEAVYLELFISGTDNMPYRVRLVDDDTGVISNQIMMFSTLWEAAKFWETENTALTWPSQ